MLFFESPNCVKNKKTILIIEDDDDLRQTLTLSFIENGLTVHCAANGTEAFSILKQNQVDMILTDLEMPEKNGLEFIAEFRLSNRKTPVLLMSGASSPNPSILKKFKISAFYQKPFLPIKEILNHIKNEQKSCQIDDWCSHPDLNGDRRFRKP